MPPRACGRGAFLRFLRQPERRREDPWQEAIRLLARIVDLVELGKKRREPALLRIEESPLVLNRHRVLLPLWFARRGRWPCGDRRDRRDRSNRRGRPCRRNRLSAIDRRRRGDRKSTR